MGGTNTPPEEPKKTPDAPKVPVQKPDTGDVKDATGKAVGAAAAETAGNLADPGKEKPKEGQNDELPDNQWSRYYYDLKERVEKNPNLQNPFTNMMLAFLLLAAKWSPYIDLVPNQFVKRLDTDTDLKDKKFDKLQIEAVCKGQGKTDEEALKKLAEAEKAAGKKLDLDTASTKYACSVLWGIDNIGDASSLAAYLKHTKKETKDEYVPLYELSTLNEIKQQEPIARGTIVIFIPDFMKGTKIVAFATGNKDEFKYFDANTGKVEVFNLRADNSKIKSEFGLAAVFTPNIADYQAAKEVNPTDTKVATPEDAKTIDTFKKITDEAIKKLESENQLVANMLADLSRNPNPGNKPVLLQCAEANEKAAKEALLSIQKQFNAAQGEYKKAIEYYLEKLGAIVDAASKNAETAKNLKIE